MTLSKVAESTVDELVYDATQPIQTKSIDLPGGDGVIERGTVVSVDADGKSLVWTDGGDGAASYIVADDVDTGADDGVSVVALVYVAGKFSRNRLAQNITAKAEKELENAGIYLADIA